MTTTGRFLSELLFLQLLLAPTTTAAASNVSSAEDYQAVLGRDSNKNPFEQGCLYQLLPGWNKKRVCNSEDPDTVLFDTAEYDDAAALCHKPNLDYPEVRIFAPNWEAGVYEAWILQLLLSELLNVATTIETGTPAARLSFYEPSASYEYGLGKEYEALGKAAALAGDCGLARTQTNIDESGLYEPCAHVVPEVWNTDSPDVKKLVFDGVLESPKALGIIGQVTFYIPKFTAERDPTLVSYFGLKGEKNRRKLAQAFPRPTTWKEYCEQVSLNNCSSASNDNDFVATRPPPDDEQGKRFFVEGEYTGHFRLTDKNDCDLHPTNCTGHFADFPCFWNSPASSFFYHLNISLESEGEEPNSGGYSPLRMIELWKAANYTKSNLLMVWWSPEVLYESIKVTFPTATQTCVKNRGEFKACAENPQDRLGDAKGVCELRVHTLQKVMVSALYDLSYDPTVPDAKHSPAYDALNLFTISELHLGDIFNYVELNRSATPREAVCRWAVDNIEFIQSFVPRKYPRTLEEANDQGPLMHTSMAVGGTTMLLVLWTGWSVYKKRKERIMIYAQVQFLLLLLAGSLTLSVGAIITASAPSDASCVAAIWLINIGYTFELVPLIVKVAAINRLMNAARQLRRVVLQRRSLFGTVALISTLIVVFLILWTTLDPPRKVPEYELSDNMTEDGETIVAVSYHCNSESDVWVLVGAGWNTVLLICATVLAIQTRKVRQDFNESRSLAILIYSHFMFVVLRVAIILFLSGAVRGSVLAQVSSLIFSFDTMATIIIYFVPKFWSSDGERTADASSRAFRRPSAPEQQPVSRPFAIKMSSNDGVQDALQPCPPLENGEEKSNKAPMSELPICRTSAIMIR